MTSRVIRRGQLYALAAMVIWSTNYILGRLLADAVSPVTISTFRAVVACTMMCAWLSLTRGWPRFTPGLIRPFLAAGFLGIFASQYLTYLALHWTLASTATILNAVSPIVSAVLAMAAGLAPFSRELFTGLAVSGLGATLLTVLGAPAGQGISVDLGAVLIIASTVTWGLYNISVQRLGRTLPPLAVAEGAMLAGLPFLFAALAVEHPRTCSPPCARTCRPSCFLRSARRPSPTSAGTPRCATWGSVRRWRSTTRFPCSASYSARSCSTNM